MVRSPQKRDFSPFCSPLLVLRPDGVELLQGHEEVVGGLVDEVGVARGVAGVAEPGAHGVVHVQHGGVPVPANGMEKMSSNMNFM